MLNVLVACKAQKAPGGLEHAAPYALHYEMRPGWAAAVNALLARAQACGGDALLLDDDTELTKDSLDHVFAHYDRADIFGLDLHDLRGGRQQGARHVLTGDGALVDWIESGPAYVAHVSTSAVYIKARALSLRFPEWPGAHWEDMQYCLNAWLQGFEVMAVPGYVAHAIEGGIGSTKRHEPQFYHRWMANKEAFEWWLHTSHAIEQGIIPIGAREL